MSRYDRIDLEIRGFRSSDHDDDGITGAVSVVLSASDSADNEANAARTAEQMVRELFARMRAKGVA